jgi:hypothetical protein
VGQDTSKGNGGADQGVEFFVAADGELQVARRDTLDFEILCGIAGEFEYFGGKVFKNGGQVDGSLGANTGLLSGNVAEMTLDTTAGKLQMARVWLVNAVCYRMAQATAPPVTKWDGISLRATYLEPSLCRVRLGGFGAEISSLSAGLATGFT